MCGIFAIYCNNDSITSQLTSQSAATHTLEALHSLQHRGQDGAGIWFKGNNVDNLITTNGLVSSFNLSEYSDKFDKTYIGIGHVRYPTNKSTTLQPVQINKMVFAYNGDILDQQNDVEFVTEHD